MLHANLLFSTLTYSSDDLLRHGQMDAEGHGIWSVEQLATPPYDVQYLLCVSALVRVINFSKEKREN